MVAARWARSGSWLPLRRCPTTGKPMGLFPDERSCPSTPAASTTAAQKRYRSDQLLIEKTRRLVHGFRNVNHFPLRILPAADGSRPYRQPRRILKSRQTGPACRDESAVRAAARPPTNRKRRCPRSPASVRDLHPGRDATWNAERSRAAGSKILPPGAPPRTSGESVGYQHHAARPARRSRSWGSPVPPRPLRSGQPGGRPSTTSETDNHVACLINSLVKDRG
jgi:hypothetical protein